MVIGQAMAAWPQRITRQYARGRVAGATLRFGRPFPRQAVFFDGSTPILSLCSVPSSQAETFSPANSSRRWTGRQAETPWPAGTGPGYLVPRHFARLLLKFPVALRLLGERMLRRSLSVGAHFEQLPHPRRIRLQCRHGFDHVFVDPGFPRSSVATTSAGVPTASPAIGFFNSSKTCRPAS